MDVNELKKLFEKLDYDAPFENWARYVIDRALNNRSYSDELEDFLACEDSEELLSDLREWYAELHPSLGDEDVWGYPE